MKHSSQLDSATQYIQASRPELAEKEQREADFLAGFLPALLSEAEIDRVLKEAISEHASEASGDPRRVAGKVFRAFYSKVDRSTVDPDAVKRRMDMLLSA